MTQTKIQISHLRKSFGTKKVLDGVNLSVNKGESLVILGGSGSGKSVLIKCVIGLMNPDSGNIQIDNQEVIGLSHKERSQLMHQFGMLFQGGALFDSLPVYENITFGLAQRKNLNKTDALEIAVEMLKKVGLGSDTAFLYPSELSGGMQKRVSLARAICTNPQIILFDEPTTGLDPIMSGVINNLIREIVTDMGATSITITHDMSSMVAIADKVAMLYQGKILWYGSNQEVRKTDNPYIKQFINGSIEGPISTYR
jgi:phospholipid/cholesterol/gamma-HCH transport system ATP-binding protein